MPENVSLAFVRLSSMVAWIAEHPGVHVDDIGAHFGRTRRQVRRDIEYLASVGDSLPGESFEVDWGAFRGGAARVTALNVGREYALASVRG